MLILERSLKLSWTYFLPMQELYSNYVVGLFVPAGGFLRISPCGEAAPWCQKTYLQGWPGFPMQASGGWQMSTCAEKQQQTSWCHTVFRYRQTPILCNTVENLETRKIWQKWPVISTWRNEEWWLIFGVFSFILFLHRWSHIHSFVFWIGRNYFVSF